MKNYRHLLPLEQRMPVTGYMIYSPGPMPITLPMFQV